MDDGSVTLKWEAPDGFHDKNAHYVVEYDGQRYLLSMNQTEYTIKSGQEMKSFTVKVRFFKFYQESIPKSVFVSLQ